MSRPKMIGAHVPKKKAQQRHKCALGATRDAFRAAYDQWAQRPGRGHLQRNFNYGL